MTDKTTFNKNVYKRTGDLLSVKEAADLLGTHPNTIRRWAEEGKIKSTRVGARKDRKFNKDELLKETLNVKVVDGKQEAYEKYYDYLKSLFKRTIEKNPVESLYNTLQVSGMHYGHWDPTYEIYDFFDDFNKLLAEESKKDPSSKRVYRIGLLMYGHAIEMALPWNLLANALNILNGRPYNVSPFLDLVRRKKGSLYSIPPSTKQKMVRVKELAREAKEEKLVEIIDEFFSDTVRNSFYHSDYCLTDTEFRYSDGGIASSKPLEEIDHLISRCFAFYEALLNAHSWTRAFYKAVKPYHKWPNYEVFEILKNDKEVYGFKVHFSNGQVAKFTREPEKVEAINLHFDHDGSINFFAGNLDKLTKQWLLDGKPFAEKQ